MSWTSLKDILRGRRRVSSRDTVSRVGSAGRRTGPRVLVIGLDCADPALMFDRWRAELPNLASLMRDGVYGPLRSTDPPITVPAWMSMATGQDPGALGIYGFRNRRDHSYREMTIPNRSWVQEPPVWDILGQHGLTSIVIGVPLTYPPRPMQGITIAGILTPNARASYTFPVSVREEIDRISGGYVIDVDQFRLQDREALHARIVEGTRRRFEVVKAFLTTKPWDLFMFVEIGVDRVHHAFWRYMDPCHPSFQPGHRFKDVIRDYYRMIDLEIGDILDRIPSGTHVMVVSDHGAQPLMGGFCVNDFLVEAGYLRLRHPPDGPSPLIMGNVDWANTTAWGEGGYYSRIFMNVRGREPEGAVSPESYEEVREGLESKLEATVGPDGSRLGTVVMKPETIYRRARGVPPDLLVYFGDLAWRSIGTVGHPSLWTEDNDAGPDDANHARDGILIYRRPGTRSPTGPGPRGYAIYDVAPTILEVFGISPPPEMIGHRIP